ncbi:YaeQ family protein [Colwellia sp. RSH04]|uniref:YaeQ family protein n=1 Tax=Colwellia sp. RSH04 TaxID=2305464 RepID=UPI000E56F5C3|nr:YaeQ family protein [Colwellia sp. RSH04]RHW74925.1 YaeQ family protein [Colwellia sp. RSH04]
MALKSTIYKANIELADMDRNYYDSLQLTIAKHPSETDQRMMVRLIAFLLNAHTDLSFGKGVSDEDEAAISLVNYSGEINLWIELGQVDEKRLKKACNKAEQVKLYSYGASVNTWWSQVENALNKFGKLTVEYFEQETCDALVNFISRSMDFQCSIQDGQMWLTSNDETLLIETKVLKPPQ